LNYERDYKIVSKRLSTVIERWCAE